MPLPLSFFLFELLVLGLLGLCLIHCLRQTRLPKDSLCLELLVFIVYGLVFESVAVAAGFYDYGPFILKVWHAPLVIGVGWAVIGFSAMGFSDSLNMPQWSKPFLDALFALLIDLGMDAVAIRDRYLIDSELTGMWNWGLGLNEQWFGVPYANFMAWWLVIFIMSAALRGGRYLYSWFAKPWLKGLYPFAALAVAISAFLFLLFTFISAFNLHIFLLLVVLSILVSVLAFGGRQTQLTWRSNAPVFAVPLGFHLYFLGLMLWRRLYLDATAIVYISIIVFMLHEVLLLAGRGPRTQASLEPTKRYRHNQTNI